MTAEAISTAPPAAGTTAFTTEAALHELDRIAHWWLMHAFDREQGGFHGEIDADGRPVRGARKHVVMNARLLWFFSEVARGSPQSDLARRCRVAADRAYHWFLDHFDDPGFGGAYWSLEADGRVADGKKQVYAQCFCIYALAAYFRLSGDESALTKARDYLALIRENARDGEHGGYFEAFGRDWSPRDDMRLGEDDLNAPKTMNTHLHLLEACTALHRAAPDPASRTALRESIDLLLSRVVRGGNERLGMYFDNAWNDLSAGESFGHQVEASWLLQEAAGTLADPVVATAVRPVVLALAESGLKRLRDDGCLPDRHPADVDDSIWWVQAEALVGFLNAYELTGDSRWHDAAGRVWTHIVRSHIDPDDGEWRWLGAAGADAGDAGPNTHYRAGAWKGPYHNGRAMMESARRLSALEAN